MFSSTALFKDITCPELSTCSLLNCIFQHQVLPSAKKNLGTPQRSSVPMEKGANLAHSHMEAEPQDDDPPLENRPRKKRRIDADNTDEGKCFVGSPRTTSTLNSSDSSFHNFSAGEMVQASRIDFGSKDISRKSLDGQPQKPKIDYLETTLKRKSLGNDLQKDHATPARKVLKKASGTTTELRKTSGVQSSQDDVRESLNPRMIPNPPASHAIRIKLLALLHEHITRLNDQTKLSSDPSKASIVMSSQQVMTEAMNIEASIAEGNPFVYQNVMKQRIIKYKNMTQEAWEKERLTQNHKSEVISTVNPDTASGIETGLSLKDELAILPRIHANQELLSAFGYVTSAPTQQEIDAAAQGVEAANCWEVCERCTTRFQVFPGRRAEDGVSTTGGPCRYHSGRLGSVRGDKYGFSCCSEGVGTKGCRSADTHVFKVSDPKRLAAIMPFMETPENPARLSEEAVAFDCEMGYTTLGLELIRLTAISWPTGAELVDVLVRPLGEVLELNSAFSGVWPEIYTKALENGCLRSADYKHNESGGAHMLRMVESPAEARALLFKYISPTTSLIGHALENDLKAVRIVHPGIVDTVDLFPHSHGLPKRNSLKSLSKKILNRVIQSDSKGHDPHEDARMAGDLVKVMIRDVVKKWKAKGYKFGDGEFPPIERDPDPVQKYLY